MARKQPFLTDVKTLDRATVVKLLNEALATEIVCMLRYRRGDCAQAARERAGDRSWSTPFSRP